MVDVMGIIPTSIGGVIALLIEVVIISVILMITEKFLAHEMTIKHTFVMALVAYLIVPLVIALAGIAIPFAGYIIPLIIWIVLGELLLKGSRGGRLKAAAVAFIIYLVLTFAGVPLLIASALPF